jgi:NAD-dependent dihydropyrimidine dehydrogenase PreA subunit
LGGDRVEIYLMKRKIIEIDEEKCTGCGVCIPDCPEGALQVIDGKARLVSDLFCDGLGACIGTCPEGAICVIEREAGPYSEEAVMEKIVPQGESVVRAHLEHLLGHGEEALYSRAIDYLNAHEIPVPPHGADARKPRGRLLRRCGPPRLRGLCPLRLRGLSPGLPAGQDPAHLLPET